MFTMARNVYKACMDLDKIEATGLGPLKDMLRVREVSVHVDW